VKNLSLILNGILLVAVASLFYLHFSKNTPTTSSSTGKSVSSADIPVAFINSDTLLNNYKRYDDLMAQFVEKRNNAEKQLNVRGQALQAEAVSFERRAKAGMLSNNELKVGQEDLMMKERQLSQYSQDIQMGLMEEEKRITLQLYDSIVSYLKDYNKDKKFRYILNYTKGGGILIADETFDITQEVLKGLNDKYEVEKKDQPAADKKEETKK